MPELSRFFGIIIRMFVEFNAQHHLPHFHAYYQSEVGIFSLNPVELISGKLPRRQQRFVEAWAELHQDELITDWELLQTGHKPNPIKPLESELIMKHPIYRVTKVDIVSDYILHIQFDDQSEQTIDFHPILIGDLYSPLKDLSLFNQVSIDPEISTLIWPNGADFDPAILHDWPQHRDGFIERTSQWTRVSA